MSHRPLCFHEIQTQPVLRRRGASPPQEQIPHRLHLRLQGATSVSGKQSRGFAESRSRMRRSHDARRTGGLESRRRLYAAAGSNPRRRSIWNPRRLNAVQTVSRVFLSSHKGDSCLRAAACLLFVIHCKMASGVRPSSPSRSMRMVPLTSPAAHVKAVSTGRKGDEKLLALLPTLRAPAVYCINGHGGTITSDPLTVSPYSGSPRSGLPEPATVPPECAYITSAPLGHVAFFGTEAKKEFFKRWANRANTNKFRNAGNPNPLYDALRGEIRTFLELPHSDKSVPTSVVFRFAGEEYSSSEIYPFLAWNDEDGIRCASSGLKPCPGGYVKSVVNRNGVPREEIEFHDSIELPSLGEPYSDELLSDIFNGSVFPTVDELLADVELRRRRLEEYTLEDGRPAPDSPAAGRRRYNAVEGYINEHWRCTQQLLFAVFPGVHYHLICRNESDPLFAKTLRPPRRLSQSGMEGVTAALTEKGGALAAHAVKSLAERNKSSTERLMAEERVNSEVRELRAQQDRSAFRQKRYQEKLAAEEAKQCSCTRSCASVFRCSWCPCASKKQGPPKIKTNRRRKTRKYRKNSTK